MEEKNYVYSLNGEEFYYHSVEEAVDDYLAHCGDNEDIEVMRGEVVTPNISEFIDADNILDMIAESIYEECGEGSAAEDYCMDLMSNIDKKELQQLVAGYIESKLPVDFGVIKNVVKIEELDEYFN